MSYSDIDLKSESIEYRHNTAKIAPFFDKNWIKAQVLSRACPACPERSRGKYNRMGTLKNHQNQPHSHMVFFKLTNLKLTNLCHRYLCLRYLSHRETTPKSLF